LENGEVYDELDDTSDSDVSTMEIIEEELKKLKKLQKNKVTNHTLKLDSGVTQDKTQILDNPMRNEQSDLINSDEKRLRRNSSLEFRDTSQNIHTRKVSFSELHSINNEDNVGKETSQRICFASQDDICDEDSDDDIRISFSHSSYTSNIIESNTEIKTPGDIYRVFSVPKSILKRSPNDIPNQIAPPLVHEDDSTEDEIDCPIRSLYNSVSRYNNSDLRY
jgi:hypothetical protein